MKKIKKLSKSKFYNILDSVLPDGDRVKSKRSIYFTRINLDGLNEMHSYSTDKRLYEFLEYKPFTSLDETKNYLQNLINIESNNNPSAICWFIRRVSDDRMIGTARLVEINFKRQSAVWGYGIDPKLWGEGLIFEIQETLKKYVFEKLSLNRLSGVTMINNKRTIATILASGFKEEGILKEFYRDSDGNFVDAWCYGLVAKDYFTSKNEKTFEKNKKDISIEKIIEVISSELSYSPITPASSMKSISEWDSMSHINIILALENKFEINFNADEIAKCVSVKAIYEIFTKRS